MKILYTFFLVIIFPFIVHSQNLVPNPSFDDYRGRRTTMRPWRMINTVDYFVYDEAKADKPLRTKIKDKNFVLRPARTGKAYTGIRYWPRYYEYLIVELSEKLEKDERYYFEMYVVLSEHSNCYLRSLGVSFYSFIPPYSQTSAVREFRPQIEVYRHHGIKPDSAGWVKISDVFTAIGRERFMTIGNFSINNRTRFKKRKLSSFIKREAYYCIDDVALYKLDSLGRPIKEKVRDEDEIIAENNPIFNLQLTDCVEPYYKQIEFPPSSYELTYESYKKLAHIIGFMNKQTNVKINIVGFASKEESSNYERLAQRRANSVLIFLTGNRVLKDRIKLFYSTSVCDIDDDIKSDNLCHYAKILFNCDKDDVKAMESEYFNFIK